MHRHFVELEAVAQAILDLVSDAVGVGHIGLTVYRDGQLGEAVVAGPARADGVRDLTPFTPSAS